MIVIATGFPLSLQCFDDGCVLGRMLCGVFQDRCADRRNITEILLKTALNTIQTINLLPIAFGTHQLIYQVDLCGYRIDRDVTSDIIGL